MHTPIMTRFLRFTLLTALLLAAAWIVARAPMPSVQASVAPGPVRQSEVVGSGPYKAGLVVRFDDGRVETRCVAFSDTQIGGDQLLTSSGLSDIVFSGEGALCRIDGEGCASDDCFCRCTDLNDCQYWAYYNRQGGAWVYSQLGAMNSIVSNGDLQGWSWGQGDFQQGVPPPETTFEQVCPASSGTNDTPTVTPSPTVTNTPPNTSGPSAAPQATFYATLQSVAPSQCTTLNWHTVDATSVTFDGAPVALSGSQQVCPTANQTWTLQVSNGTGQVTKQASVRVTASSPPTPTATPSPVVVASTPVRAAGATQPVLSTPQGPIATQGPRQLPTVAKQAFVATPGGAGGLAGGGVPLAPTAEPLLVLTPTPQPTPTRYIFGPLATETPRPRRALGEDGRPTPTPILLARVAAGAHAGAPAARARNSSASETSAGALLVESRAFTPDLMPQYAAYLATMAVLLAMGRYVLRRRQSRAPATVRQSNSQNEPITGPGRKE